MSSSDELIEYVQSIISLEANLRGLKVIKPRIEGKAKGMILTLHGESVFVTISKIPDFVVGDFNTVTELLERGGL